MADETMVQNVAKPHQNYEHNDEDEWEDQENDESNNDAEFNAINAQLDQLHSVLDNIEKKNDNIHAALVELLRSNREVRRQFQESQKNNDSPMPAPQP